MTDTEPEDLPERRRQLTDTPAGQAVFVLLWMLGSLATVAALIGAFFLGRMIQAPDSQTDVVKSQVVEESPGLVDLTGGPRPEGEWVWHELRGGECIADFEGAFQESFTVVSCSLPHGAQLVVTELLSGTLGDEFPGEDEAQATASEICVVDDRINFVEAQNYSDLIVDYSFPVTKESWDDGYRVAYCFVTRSSGGLLTASLSG